MKLALLLLVCLSTARSESLSDFERGVLDEINKARENPRYLLPHLEMLFKRFDGKYLFLSSNVRVETQEGAAAVRGAIDAVAKIPNAGKLSASPPLTRAARDMRSAQGKTGAIGHYDPSGKGPVERAKKYGKLKGKSGENVTYGSFGGNDPIHVVLAMVVDDGVLDRGHRRNLFDPDFRKVGIACGKHQRYETMCVFDLAHDILPQ